MRQLLLDIRPQAEPSFERFVPGANAELLARLADLAGPACYDAIYVWGPAGSGRSHLLRATEAKSAAAGRQAAYAAGAQVGETLPMPAGGLLIVDDVDRLSEAGQVALFRAFNTARLIGLALLLAGPVPPARLALREDLRSRIGSALTYEVKPLSDEDKAETLARHAAGRGMKVERETLDYLLCHAPRDLPYLMAVLDALDRTSLEQQRPVTLPLLREVLGAASPDPT
jgi:DnaA family protein